MLITSRVITSRAMRPWVFVYSRTSALLSEKNVNHHEPRCSPIANACRIKSPSLTMPTTLPSAATTGTPLMRLACRGNLWDRGFRCNRDDLARHDIGSSQQGDTSLSDPQGDGKTGSA